MNITTTQICLHQLRFHAFHGVTPAEQDVGSDFTVDVILTISRQLSELRSDRLEATINYAEAYSVIRETFMPTCQTLEAVASRILEALFDAFPQLEGAEIEVCKVNPPLGADCRSASVRLEATQ